MRDPKADRVRIIHILEAIGHIEDHASAVSENELDNDPMLRFSIVKLIEIVGEAANMLTVELRSRHPEVPWSRIINMRHRLVHDYFNVNTAVVSDVVHVQLPTLKIQLVRILDGLEHMNA
ncbi:MAG: DUF86 domain-containing protein [Flavobacteriales bacterium]|nr:DUF86 domain-containing protein [Flavobacteriales bacterium]MBK6946638.1 DUF86 domain-containing protein [Flavobacteriales bacterium]MBK7298580.1 DUF86 domain-containing protein [Flavobacteriales bacterium]MBK9534512.1 DUF86 domain-containing protein [Flavobacteriales bacterium]MBP9139635.1 DUF86 domain-containing protein [Flavobacteriales bacterium]